MAQLTHRLWMSRALEHAQQALAHGDVPVGAVVVRDGAVVAAAHNRREVDQDPTAHAEILALQSAASELGSWRLERCTLYVTLEPCTMCAGAIVLARVPALVYGASDPKAGAAGSLYDLVREPRLNHRVDVTTGVMETECGATLRTFFRAARARSASDGPRAHSNADGHGRRGTLAGDPATLPPRGGVA